MSSNRKKPGGKPSSRGSRVGEVKQTGYNGASSLPSYWRWNGSDWESISKGTFDNLQNSSSPSSSPSSGVNSPTGSLRYPIDFTSDSPGTPYVKFTFLRYKEGKGQLSSGAGKYVDESLFEAAGGFPEYIIVNMPQDISTQFGAQWGGKSFGFLSKDIAKGAGNLATGNIGGTLESLGNIVTKATEGADAIKAAAAAAAVAAINKIPGVGGNLTINDIAQGTTSKILNPNVELMYEGPTLRTLSLNMRLFAREEGETNIIRDIGRAFRKAALPSEQNERFIKVPPLLKVEFMTGSNHNENLPKHRPFAITAVQVNFTSDGQYIEYYDGKLPTIEIALELQETKIIFAEDVDQGY